MSAYLRQELLKWMLASLEEKEEEEVGCPICKSEERDGALLSES